MPATSKSTWASRPTPPIRFTQRARRQVRLMRVGVVNIGPLVGWLALGSWYTRLDWTGSDGCREWCWPCLARRQGCQPTCKSACGRLSCPTAGAGGVTGSACTALDGSTSAGAFADQSCNYPEPLRSAPFYSLHMRFPLQEWSWAWHGPRWAAARCMWRRRLLRRARARGASRQQVGTQFSHGCCVHGCLVGGLLSG